MTGVLLIWDLEHPRRFYLIFTRHHWRSWLVRGSFIIGGYGAAVALSTCSARWPARAVTRQVAAGFGAAARARGRACYTAYLFAQAKARDLWQSPLLAAAPGRAGGAGRRGRDRAVRGLARPGAAR